MRPARYTVAVAVLLLAAIDHAWIPRRQQHHPHRRGGGSSSTALRSSTREQRQSAFALPQTSLPPSGAGGGDGSWTGGPVAGTNSQQQDTVQDHALPNNDSGFTFGGAAMADIKSSTDTAAPEPVTPAAEASIDASDEAVPFTFSLPTPAAGSEQAGWTGGPMAAANTVAEPVPDNNSVHEDSVSTIPADPKDNTFDDTVQAETVQGKQEQLSGEEIGEKYLLCDSKQSTSGKSHIYKAYKKCPDSGVPTGEQVIIKVSDNTAALEREQATYDKVDSGVFVDTHEYMAPLCDEDNVECQILQDNGALVLELGQQDLKAYLDSNGPLRGAELQAVAHRCVECLRNLHDNDMVWTELKAENFVRQECGTIKGIDLESAVPHRGNPIDYSPKACPPEFAIRYLCGTEPTMEMEYNFDIWSMGMLLLELATGEHFFENMHNIDVAQELKNNPTTMGEATLHIPDANLRDLIQQCLQVDKDARPTVEQVANHAYFHSS